MFILFSERAQSQTEVEVEVLSLWHLNHVPSSGRQTMWIRLIPDRNKDVSFFSALLRERKNPLVILHKENKRKRKDITGIQVYIRSIG